MTKLILSLAVCAAVIVPPLTGHGLSAAAEEKHEHKEGDHHDHDHGKDEHDGEKSELGTKEIGGFKVQVTQVGVVTPGEEAIFIIKPQGNGEPKAVRAWVGVESGQGSIKTKAEEEKEGEWHAHHQVSKPLPAKAPALWVELETTAGKRTGSFEYKK